MTGNEIRDPKGHGLRWDASKQVWVEELAGYDLCFKSVTLASVRISYSAITVSGGGKETVKTSEALPAGKSSGSPGETRHEVSPERRSNGFWPNSKYLWKGGS